MRRWIYRMTITMTMSLAMMIATSGAAAADDAFPQQWTGSVELPGARLDFTVVFTLDENGQVAATIDIPAQHARALPLQDVKLDSTSIQFSIQKSGADFRFEIQGNATKATGTLTQMGQTFPATLHKLAADAPMPQGPVRPQTPKPPFPYSEVDVTITNQSDGVTLAGTLVIPDKGESFPVVILLTGSGPQDRDETLFDHKPFAVIADHLARNGIASLRCDDRGVGGSTGSLMDSTTEQLTGDVAAMIDFVRTRSEIDRDRIGLLGHSEGAAIAAAAAVKDDAVAFLILMAGAGVSGDEILRQQMEALLIASRVPGEARDAQLAAQADLLDATISGADEDALRPHVVRLVKLQSGGAVPENSPQFAAMVDAQVRNLLTPWFQSFLWYDPQKSLRRVTCPTLVLAGALDLQVPPRENLAAIRRALSGAGNSSVTVKQFRGLNHLFQPARAGLPDEYQRIEETISPPVLETIANWIESTQTAARR